MQFHTPTHGPNDVAFKRALLHAINLAQSSGTNEVLILIHGLNQLDGVISAVLGQAITKILKKKHVAKAGNVTVYLETERIKSQFRNGVIFSPHISSTLLAIALNDTRATDFVYVPWTNQELTDYLQNNPHSTAI
jgi:hypothetical protein